MCSGFGVELLCAQNNSRDTVRWHYLSVVTMSLRWENGNLAGRSSISCRVPSASSSGLRDL